MFCLSWRWLLFAARRARGCWNPRSGRDVQPGGGEEGRGQARPDREADAVSRSSSRRSIRIPGLDGEHSPERSRAIEGLAEKTGQRDRLRRRLLADLQEGPGLLETACEVSGTNRSCPGEQRLEVRDALVGQFKNQRFDQGLEKAAEILDRSSAAAPGQAADQRGCGRPRRAARSGRRSEVRHGNVCS